MLVAPIETPNSTNALSAQKVGIRRGAMYQKARTPQTTPPVQTSRNGAPDLATVLKDRGEYTEAEKLVRDLVSRSREAFGDTHRDTLTVMINLGTMLQRRGRESTRKQRRF